jgi:hypothetical protein
LNRLFVFKFNITNSAGQYVSRAWTLGNVARNKTYPLDRPLIRSFTICASLTGPAFSSKNLLSLSLRKRAASC